MKEPSQIISINKRPAEVLLGPRGAFTLLAGPLKSVYLPAQRNIKRRDIWQETENGYWLDRR